MPQHQKVVVITRESSNLLSLLKAWGNQVEVIAPEDIPGTDLNSFDAIALIGGTSDKPLLLKASERVLIEEQLQKGKRIFAEFVGSIGHVYSAQPESTRFWRMVYCSDEKHVDGLELGMLIDDQCGTRIKPHDIACSHSKPILQFTKIHAHDAIPVTEDICHSISDRALWFDNPSNLLICSFRLSNFIAARHAPKARITSVVEFILNWLFDSDKKLEGLDFVYSTGTLDSSKNDEELIAESARLAVGWLNDGGVLSDEGKSGILEGYSTDIYADGVQRMNEIRRADCIGEASLPYFLNYRLTGNSDHLAKADNLLAYLYDNYICKDEGHLHGMMRWTDEAWGICYQDDVARAIIPQLLKSLYSGTSERLEETFEVLSFLVRTTGSDGTRLFRTDNINLTSEESILELQGKPGNLPSAHYNAFYYAALCLAYKLGGDVSFMHAARAGMDAILAVYPETTREQSETQEYCRLILPLSWMYEITGDDKYKDWLYRVTKELQTFKHESGAYLEWDSGYKASMRNEVGEGESSLLAHNGDPIVDLLYSNNWLPMAFIQAYFVTEDEYFLELWQENSLFMAKAQLRSADTTLHGAWARAYDVEKDEVYGSPADFGWGPWAIESGWTVAEIASGLLMGLMRDELKPFHKKVEENV